MFKLFFKACGGSGKKTGLSGISHSTYKPYGKAFSNCRKNAYKKPVTAIRWFGSVGKGIFK